MAAFGETIIYTPADSVFEPFECMADFGIEPETDDSLEPHKVTDKCRCRIRYEALNNGGVDQPVKQVSGKTGDTIRQTYAVSLRSG